MTETLTETQVEIMRMQDEAMAANYFAARMREQWEVAREAERQADKDYRAAQANAARCNDALIKALSPPEATIWESSQTH